MRHIHVLIAGAAALSYAAVAAAAEPAKSAAAKPVATKAATKPLQFSDLGGVKSWRAGEKDTIVYVQGQDNNWYRVDTYETCMKFVNDKGLRFITEEIETGERLSKVIADKYICTVIEITKMDAPPPRQATK
ncbi:MAG: DUF6491 family protein [Proteobacteria bacterium]|nr:DUF6491 family protein [Pseudomonadota bacterium]